MIHQTNVPVDIILITETVTEKDFSNSIIFVTPPANVLSCNFKNCFLVCIDDRSIKFNRCNFIKSPILPAKDITTLNQIYNSYKELASG